MSTNQPKDSTADAAAPGTGADEDLEQLDFEAAMEELEELVDRMEAGDLTLEASLVAYERGVRLARHCQLALRNAELTVNKLADNGDLEPLDPDTLDED